MLERDENQSLKVGMTMHEPPWMTAALLVTSLANRISCLMLAKERAEEPAAVASCALFVWTVRVAIFSFFLPYDGRRLGDNSSSIYQCLISQLFKPWKEKRSGSQTPAGPALASYRT